MDSRGGLGLATFTQRRQAGRRAPAHEVTANGQGVGGRLQGTVAVLMGRFPASSVGFRFERMEMLDPRRNALLGFPIHEKAKVAPGLCLGMQVVAVVRDGSIVSVQKKPNAPRSTAETE